MAESLKGQDVASGTPVRCLIGDRLISGEVGVSNRVNLIVYTDDPDAMLAGGTRGHRRWGTWRDDSGFGYWVRVSKSKCWEE